MVTRDRDVAGRVHDELMPYLFASAATLSNLQKSSSLSGQDAESIEQTAAWIDQARDVARQILSDLDHREHAAKGTAQPDASDDNPVRGAREFLESVRVAGDVNAPPVTWCNVDALDRLSWSSHVAEAAQSIVVELIRNAWRHSRARHVTVQAAFNDDHWEVSIHDDGIGLTGNLDAIAGHGLKLVQHRADANGIKLVVSSTANSGTRWMARGHLHADV